MVMRVIGSDALALMKGKCAETGTDAYGLIITRLRINPFIATLGSKACFGIIRASAMTPSQH